MSAAAYLEDLLQATSASCSTRFGILDAEVKKLLATCSFTGAFTNFTLSFLSNFNSSNTS